MSTLRDRTGEEDPPPREDQKTRRWADHKTLRLCHQVQKALHTALQGECGDEVLQQLYVVSVEPGADPSRLEVTVEVPPALNAGQVLVHLEKARGLLRTLVAQAISRKKVPDLVFRLAGSPEPGS